MALIKHSNRMINKMNTITKIKYCIITISMIQIKRITLAISTQVRFLNIKLLKNNRKTIKKMNLINFAQYVSPIKMKQFYKHAVMHSVTLVSKIGIKNKNKNKHVQCAMKKCSLTKMNFFNLLISMVKKIIRKNWK